MVDRLVYYFSRQGINNDICQAVKSPLRAISPPWASSFSIPGSRTLDWVGPLHREVDRVKARRMSTGWVCIKNHVL
mgnify:CR=1 FL=1